MRTPALEFGTMTGKVSCGELTRRLLSRCSVFSERIRKQCRVYSILVILMSNLDKVEQDLVMTWRLIVVPMKRELPMCPEASATRRMLDEKVRVIYVYKRSSFY